MKTILYSLATFLMMNMSACNSVTTKTESKSNTSSENSTPADLRQAGVQDDISQKDIVKIAVGSPDHSTLVAALKQADYVNDLSNAGPFTVFAPTNSAFSKLPAGTVEGLMKPESKSALQNILEYHVALGVFKQDMVQDGQSIGMANGDYITLNIKNGKLMVNGKANVVAAVPASNGLVYIVDEVLLPPSK